MPDSGSSLTHHKYRIYGVTVDSEFALSSVEPCANAQPTDISIVSGTQDYFQQNAAGLRQDGEDSIRYTILADHSVYIRIDHVLEAIVAADGRRVTAGRLEDADDRTYEANLANFALSASLTLQGEECLHATVVEIDGRAVGLLGPGGAGKSTLAAFLLTEGATLVTDDMLRVTFAEGDVMAYPGPYRLKLFEETALRFLPGAARDGAFNRLSCKIMVEPTPQRVAGSPPWRAALPMSALFWLGNDEPSDGEHDVSVRRLAGIEKVKVLTQSTMARRYMAPERLKRQLRFAERMARIMPIYALDYRRDYALIEKVARELRQTVAR
jgi:hypothetical protein